MTVEIEAVMKWIGVGSAVIGLAYLVMQVWKLSRDSREQLLLGLGPLPYEVSAYEQMHVLNIGAKTATLSDYGFIINNAQFFSAPYERCIQPDSWGGQFGSTLKTHEHLCVGFNSGYGGAEVKGAYALSAVTGKLWLMLDKNIPVCQRISMWCILKRRRGELG
jgi:hypothetical protein